MKIVLQLIRELFFGGFMKSLWSAIFSLVFFLVASFFIFYSVVEYKPKDVEVLYEYIPQRNDSEVTNNLPKSDKMKTGTLTLLTWNIGYGGMGKSMDYYFDGGTRVNPTETEFNNNYEGILKFLGKNATDVNLLQEVDIKSQRSYFNDMGAGVMNILGGSNFFSANYKNPYVPFPLKSPIGTVHGGLFTSTRLTPDLVQKVPLPSENDWPKSLFNLKRNVLEIRMNYKGKELIIGNIHNSAFDKGDVRDKQLKAIADRYMDEYSKGNYVILGGDFNMMFPGTEMEGFYPKTKMLNMNAELFPSNWNFVFDGKKPTNRDASVPYNPSVSGLSIIDGFILSPNVKLMSIKVHDLGFEYSDHQPISIKVVLN